MEFDKTLKAMALAYPELFQYRAEALNQLFCVNGNGYDWVDGQLVDWMEDNPDPLLVDKRYQRAKELIEAGYELPFINDEMNRIRVFMHHDWYPLCEYSNIVNIPDDVQKDWLMGAIETLESMTFAGVMKKNKEIQAAAQKTTKRLEERFPEAFKEYYDIRDKQLELDPEAAEHHHRLEKRLVELYKHLAKEDIQ